MVDLGGRTVLPGLADSHLHASMTTELIRGMGWNPVLFVAFAEGQPQASDLDESGELHMRVKSSFYADPSLPADQFGDMIRDKEQYRSEGFGIRTVKFFIDGSGLSFYLKEPFEEEWLAGLGMKAGYRGYAQWTPEELKEIFLRLDTEGLQIHLHCMTDGAVGAAVDAFAYVAQFNDIARNRHTITHLMLADKRDIERMAKMGIIAAIQPMWAIADSMSEQNGAAMLGKERIQNTYLFGSMRKAGCRISCGTDFPVTIPPSPYIGMGTGMTRTITPAHPEYETYKGIALGAEEEKVGLKEMVEGTEVIDCGGKTVLPGMCDAHCHPSISASAYSGCDLFGVYLQKGQSTEEIVRIYMERLKRFAQEHPADDLIRGTGWKCLCGTKKAFPRVGSGKWPGSPSRTPCMKKSAGSRLKR